MGVGVSEAVWDSKPSLSHSKTHSSSFSLTWSNNIKIKCKLELMNLQFPLTYLGFFSLLLPSPGTCICLHIRAYTHYAHVSTCTHTYTILSQRIWVIYCQAGSKTACVVLHCVRVRRPLPHSLGIMGLGEF